MPCLADYIETYLRSLVDKMDGECVEIRRSDLAARFRCAPSQITYVLSTRFTPERGYMVEARRGAGGHVRLHRLSSGVHRDAVRNMVEQDVQDRIGHEEAIDLLSRLSESGLLSDRDAAFLREVLLCIEEMSDRGQLRARLIRAAVFLMIGQGEGE